MKLSGKKDRKKLYGLAIKNFHMEVQNIFIRGKKTWYNTNVHQSWMNEQIIVYYY